MEEVLRAAPGGLREALAERRAEVEEVSPPTSHGRDSLFALLSELRAAAK